MNEKTVNLDCEIRYCWYDHLILHKNGDTNAVEKAIKEGDYDTFIKMYHKYNNNEEYGNMIFFPGVARLYLNNEFIGHIFITNPTGFRLITFSECIGDK